MHRFSQSRGWIGGARRWVGRKRRAATLIELFAVIAVVAVMPGTLLPALARGKETTKQIFSSNSPKQMGIGTFIYADDHSDKLPPPLYDPDQTPGMGPYNSYLLFGWGGQVGRPAEPRLAVNLGLLYAHNYIRNPDIFYCPSLKHPKGL